MVDALLCSRLPGLINVRDDPTAPFCARFQTSLMCESAYTVNSEGLHSLCKMTPFNGKVRCKPDSATFACDGRPPSLPSPPPPGLSRASQGLSASPPSASPPFPSPSSPVRHRPPPCPPVAFGDERAAPPTPPSPPPPPPPSPCHDSATHTCAADVAAPQADLRLDPFAANNTLAYRFSNERLSREWQAREQTALCSSGSISVAAAVAAGVRFNSLGISFASRRQPPPSVVKLLLSGTRESQRAAGQLILDNDAAPRRRHQDIASSLALGLKPEAKQLMNHGYVTFNHRWGLRKAFGRALKEGVRFALSNHSRTEVSGGVSKYQALHDLGAPPVPGLDALEKRAVPRMLALATAYFGQRHGLQRLHCAADRLA